MRRFIFALFCLMLPAAATEHSGRRAPGFSLIDMDFNYHDLYDYRGKIILIDFMKTSCPICNSSQRIMETVRQKFPGKVVVINVTTPPDNQNTIKQFITQHSLKSPVLYDSGQVTASYLKLTPKNMSANIALPHLFIIDHKGMIRSDYEYGGPTAAIFETLDPLMNEVTALVKEMDGGAPAPKAGPAAPPKSPAPKK